MLEQEPVTVKGKVQATDWMALLVQVKESLAARPGQFLRRAESNQSPNLEGIAS